MTDKEVLDNAADLLEKKGWNQYHLALDVNGSSLTPGGGYYYGREPVSYCISGAILEARQSTDMGDRQYGCIVNKLLSVIGILKGNFFSHISLVRWNNDPSRTKEEVVNALRKAAILSEED